MAFGRARVLLAAVEAWLFTELGQGAKTGNELRDSLGLHERSTPDLLDTLVALRFLDAIGDRS